jgi:hypothetical protein
VVNRDLGGRGTKQDGGALAIDVDLPELEHVPTKRATLGARSWEPSLRDTGDVALPGRHHSFDFGIVGDAFIPRPPARAVMLSRYSQQLDHASRHMNDEYLYSLRISREQWNAMNSHTLD